MTKLIVCFVVIYRVIVSSCENCDSYEVTYKGPNNALISTSLIALDKSGFLILNDPLELGLQRFEVEELCRQANLTSEVVIDHNETLITFTHDSALVAETLGIHHIKFFAKITINTIEGLALYVGVPAEQVELPHPYASIQYPNYSSPLATNATCGLVVFDNNTIRLLEDDCTGTVAFPLCSHKRGSTCYTKTLEHQKQYVTNSKNRLKNMTENGNPAFEGDLSEGGERFDNATQPESKLSVLAWTLIAVVVIIVLVVITILSIIGLKYARGPVTTQEETGGVELKDRLDSPTSSRKNEATGEDGEVAGEAQPQGIPQELAQVEVSQPDHGGEGAQ